MVCSVDASSPTATNRSQVAPPPQNSALLLTCQQRVAGTSSPLNTPKKPHPASLLSPTNLSPPQPRRFSNPHASKYRNMHASVNRQQEVCATTACIVITERVNAPTCINLNALLHHTPSPPQALAATFVTFSINAKGRDRRWPINETQDYPTQRAESCMVDFQ